MNMRKILLAMAVTSLAMTLVGCNPDFSKVEQGRVIGFNKETKEVTLISDSAMDSQKPVYDGLPPAVYKLPTDSMEMGPEPKAGQRMKLDTEKKLITIFDMTTQKIMDVAIDIVDLQQPIDKEHPLVYDKAEKKAKQFPIVDKDKKTVTVYSDRQKMLCTFSVPDQYFPYPTSTWDSGDEVRLTFKQTGQALRFMNISKTDIFKK